jgi:hypothetical protein
VIWCTSNDLNNAKKKIDTIPLSSPHNILIEKNENESQIITILNNLEMARGASGI